MKTKTKTKWLDNAQVKRELIDLLRTEPRARWVDVIMAKYGGTSEGRVAVFQVFCAMEQAGELDELKAREFCEVSRVIAKTIPPPKLPKLGKTVVIALCGLAVALSSASADDRRPKHREHHNYILERQSAGQVQGVPTTRRIVGKREIDIYPNGLMFEKNNVVGVTK